MDFEQEIQNLTRFDEAYFDGSPLVPDAQYDALKKKLFDINPSHPYFGQVGSAVRGGKIDLPYPMGSLDQIYEGDYDRWIKKYDLYNQLIVISEKLDGVSIMLVYENGEFKTAYSRGNGIQGADITRHVKNIPSVPKTIEGIDYLVVRAEGIMETALFDKKYSKKYRNARQMVAGCMNRKETDLSILKDISVVAYEIVDTSYDVTLNKEDSLEVLYDLGFSVVYCETDTGATHSDSSLKETLERFKQCSKYELDGIVLTVNGYRQLITASKRDSLNPEHSVKFKSLSEDSIVEAEVMAVHWKISKSGFWKPRVEIKPVELFGTTVTFATGFNGKFISDNEIGRGTRIKITKSGSVIPYILEVVKSTNAELPEAGTWEWNESGVEIVGVGTTLESDFMKAVHFFSTLEVDLLKETSLRKIVDAYAPAANFEKIVLSVVDLLDIEWKRVLGQNGLKIHSSLHKTLRNLSAPKLLGAYPYFGQGFGVRKAKKILNEMSFDEFKQCTAEDILTVEGFDTTSESVYLGIERFKQFLEKMEPYIKLISDEQQQKSNELEGKVIVFTGFRDKQLEKDIESLGGRVASGVSGKTTTVIAIDKNEKISKLEKARKQNLEIFSKDEFTNLYF